MRCRRTQPSSTASGTTPVRQRMRIPLDQTPYPEKYLPFANEVELQRFVEDHAEKIFGLTVVASTRRGGRRLFGIDILAVDSENIPFILECKWDLVDSGALRQLAAYRGALQARWTLFERRVSEIRRQPIRMPQREPILIAIGYRYAPSVHAETPSPICLTYAYHGVTITEKLVEERGPGEVSIQDVHENAIPSFAHPKVSKKHTVIERLAPLLPELQEAFWEIDDRLSHLEGVKVVYGGKNFVRYRTARGRFAEARIGEKSVEWRFGQPGLWRDASEIGSVEMLTAADAERVLHELRRTHGDAG
jgi:hypothetical protein